jgi:putative addiction module component (TIGR02574 family)
MSTVDNTLDIYRLTREERLDLIDRLWESLEPASEKLNVPQSHQDELAQRAQRHAHDPYSGRDWADVKADVLSKLE